MPSRTPTPIKLPPYHCLLHEREKPYMEVKYMNSDKAQRKEPEFTTLIGEVGCDTNIESMHAHVLQYTSQSKTLA